MGKIAFVGDFNEQVRMRRPAAIIAGGGVDQWIENANAHAGAL
ncbi:hypothetical protein [Acidibrevibacterium fodinaquatile]|nr:hypothetical protein [Acidibrevibacterium fodinaquatile]